MNYTSSLTAAFQYCDENGIEVPPSMYIRAVGVGALKAAGDLSKVNKKYHDAITQALIKYFEGGSLTASRNAIRRGVVESFADAFDLGWLSGGGDFPIDADALSWFNSRIELEFGYVAQLMERAKMLKKEEGFDYFSWITERADGYTRTLREIYNTAALWAKRNVMVTFTGEDGAESCGDCQKLKGKRHKVSRFVARDSVPPFGRGLECHPGRRCQHYLMTDKGERLTI